MTITIDSFLESLDSVSPNAGMFSPVAGHAPWTFIINAPTAADLFGFLTGVFGTTNTAIATFPGNLNRVLPIVHPMVPTFYAYTIQSLRGIGTPTVSDPNLPGFSTGPQIPQFLLYPQYEIVIDFAPLRYTALPDAVIAGQASTADWYPPVQPPGSNPNLGPPALVTGRPTENPQPYFYVPEWDRFTWFTQTGSDEFVTAKQGAMEWIGAGGTQLARGQIQTLPRVFLQNQHLKFWWYQVPLRYLTSTKSYIKKAIGRINQYPFYIWEAGQLLYENYTPHPFTPPITQFANTDPTFPAIVQVAQLVDIEFDFLLTTRYLAPGETLPTAPPVPIQDNWVMAHHNLLPFWMDRQFHYAGTSLGQLKNNGAGTPAWYQNYGAGTPFWLSFPFELLFVDPDTPDNTPFI